MSKTHLFGEMDLDLSKTMDEIYKKAFDIAEVCGYMVSLDHNQIQLAGTDLEEVVIFFDDNGKAIKYRWMQSTDRSGDLEVVEKGEVIL